MTQIINTMMLIGGGLTALLLILLAAPQSKLSSFLMPIVGWTFTLFCGAYIISPIDFVPDMPVIGWIDDGGALAAGIASAVAAMKAGKAAA